MKISLLILIFLKKTNIGGVFGCKSRILDANLNEKLHHFLLQVFLWFVKCAGTQTLKEKKCLNDE
jgi:hypothetical protein